MKKNMSVLEVKGEKKNDAVPMAVKSGCGNCG